jgi:hypothetical protein
LYESGRFDALPSLGRPLDDFANQTRRKNPVEPGFMGLVVAASRYVFQERVQRLISGSHDSFVEMIDAQRPPDVRDRRSEFANRANSRYHPLQPRSGDSIRAKPTRSCFLSRRPCVSDPGWRPLTTISSARYGSCGVEPRHTPAMAWRQTSGPLSLWCHP